jgi:hypothetical protein
MTMRVGQLYRCQNPDCGCEIDVTKASMEVHANPRCCCGEQMKKPYEEPVLKRLDTQPRVFADIQKTRG